MTSITTACLDMAGTTVSDDGSVMAAFTAAVAESGLVPGRPGYDEAIEVVHATMGQSKIEVFRRILGGEELARRPTACSRQLPRRRPGGPGRAAARRGRDHHRAARGRDQGVPGHRVRPGHQDALLDALGWRPLIDLALSPADAGRAGHGPTCR